MKNNKRKIIALVVCLLVLLSIVVGATYANYRWGFLGTLQNNISTDDISVEFLESSNNVIGITNGLPIPDSDGKEQEETFDFAVTSKTKKDTSLGYTVSIQK